MGPPPVPVFAVLGSPDAPGALAVARSALLGDLHADGSWQSLMPPTGAYGPASSTGVADNAWPTPSGTVFYARDAGGTWMRRGTGRWWHLREHGQDLLLITPLDRAHVLVERNVTPSGGAPWTTPLAVIDLTRPAVDPPIVAAAAGELSCNVPWTAAEADTGGYRWFRDGNPLAGVTGRVRAASRYDRGHAMGCTATAKTAFGSTSIASTSPLRVPGARVAPPRPHVTGAGRVGSRLRCSAKTHVAWFSGATLATRLHTQTYVVRTRDAGRAIACQTRLADGTLTRSRAVRINYS
jgi:hypothetical protein